MNEELRVLQPMSLGDILDETLSLYRKNFVTFFGIAFLPSLFSLVVSLIAPSPVATRSSFVDDNSLLALLEQISMSTSQSPIVSLLGTLAGLLAYAALVKATADRYLSSSTSIASSFSFVFPRFIPYCLTLALILLFFFVALILPALNAILGLVSIVFVIILGFMCAFVSEVFVLEDVRYMDAIKRSRELAKGNWGRIFLIALLWGVIYIIVFLGALALIESIFLGQLIVALALLYTVGALTQPIFLIALVLLYFDIRVRKEGFDLQLLAEELAARGGPPSEFPPRPENPISGKGF